MTLPPLKFKCDNPTCSAALTVPPNLDTSNATNVFRFLHSRSWTITSDSSGLVHKAKVHCGRCSGE